MTESDSGIRELRPERGAARRWLRGPELVGLALLGVSVASLTAVRWVILDPQGSGWTVAGIVFGGLALVVALAPLSVTRTSIQLGEGRIVRRRWLVQKTVLRVDDPIAGLMAWYVGPGSPEAPMRLLVVGASVGGRFIYLNGVNWAHAALEEIAAYAGVEVVDDVLDEVGFEARLPGSFPA